jgi:hypothetical protein
MVSVGSGRASEPAQDVRRATIELVIGAVTVRVPAGAEARDVEVVLRAVAVQLMSGGLLIPPGPVRVLVATKPVDFRKGMNGLAALVGGQMRSSQPLTSS